MTNQTPSMTVSTNPTLKLHAALHAAWYTIREAYPEVPEAVIVIGEGKGSKWGHHCAEAWESTGGEGGRTTEIMVAGEGLNRGAQAVFTTLLHEAAHAMNNYHGLRDTSRQGRYHNVHFKRACEHMGMTCECGAFGWSQATLNADTLKRYAPIIERIGRCLVTYRRTAGTKAAKRETGWIKASCACGRSIRASLKTLQECAIRCGDCERDFEPVCEAGDDLAARITRTAAKAKAAGELTGFTGRMVPPVDFAAWKAAPPLTWAKAGGTDTSEVPF